MSSNPVYEIFMLMAKLGYSKDTPDEQHDDITVVSADDVGSTPTASKI